MTIMQSVMQSHRPAVAYKQELALAGRDEMETEHNRHIKFDPQKNSDFTFVFVFLYSDFLAMNVEVKLLKLMLFFGRNPAKNFYFSLHRPRDREGDHSSITSFPMTFPWLFQDFP